MMCKKASWGQKYITILLLVLGRGAGGRAKIKARNERMKSQKLGKISRVNWMVYKHRKQEILHPWKKEGRDRNRGRKDEARRADGHILLYHTGIRSAEICTHTEKKKKNQRERIDSESVKMGLHIWNLITLGEKKKKERINPGCSWWKKVPGTWDFHQNGFARERTS